MGKKYEHLRIEERTMIQLGFYFKLKWQISARNGLMTFSRLMSSSCPFRTSRQEYLNANNRPFAVIASNWTTGRTRSQSRPWQPSQPLQSTTA